ncbi:MAG: sulfurtransferase-like selenium metabolism protein YedF [Clostridiaceae bacterium]|nr:sulfurtransferase-like selenium metabolism protein YedF [Clostridiaceae bacterium]
MVNIDAKSKPCPMPVIMAKKELEKGQPFTITVDNETAVGNLTRLANAQGCTLGLTKGDGEFTLEFSAPSKKEEKVKADTYAVFFNKNSVGLGSDELGYNLAKMMLYTLTQSEDVPAYILLMNGGVKLAANEESAAHLNTLIDMGCTVMVCGTCLNFFGIAGELKAGIVSNMYDILTAMQQVSKVITA